MKKTRTLFLWIFLVLVFVMIGCNSGGSSSGSSGTTTTPTTTTTATTATDQLVGTWNQVGGGVGLVFRSNGTGNLTDGVHTINSWTLNNSTLVLNMTLNGTPEVFQLAWTNTAHTAMTTTNIGPNSSETTAYTKA